MNLVLAISVDPCGEPLTDTEIDQIVPPDRLRLGGPVVFVRAGELWVSHLVLEGESEDCQHDAALHLIALRGLSARRPAAAITIDADPGGGALMLRAGSFGADEDEVAELITSATGLPLGAEPLHRRLYVSFRIEPDAHAHLLELLNAALPPGVPAPVVDSSASAIALGFEVGGAARRPAAPRVVLRATASGLEYVHLLGLGERVTAMVYDTPCAIFVDGPQGPRLVLGQSDTTVPLPSPGYEARYLSPTDEA